MNTQAIEDGKHRARLVAAKSGASRSGNPYVSFKWMLADGTRRTIYSTSYLNHRDGSRNDKGIALVRKWAQGWDGNDPAWFERELERLGEVEVELVVKAMPSYNDPNRLTTQVQFVNPVTKREEESQRRVTLGEVSPNMLDVWEAFRESTAEMDTADREMLWLSVVETTVPNKDQDLFTDEDWQKVITALKGE